MSTATGPAATRLSVLDNLLCDTYPWGELKGIRRFVIEFLYFGIKEARACLFAGLFFISIFVVPHGGVFGIPRYDVLLIVALGIQFFMIWSRLETLDEAKAILLFHIVGFALEVIQDVKRYPVLVLPRLRL